MYETFYQYHDVIMPTVRFGQAVSNSVARMSAKILESQCTRVCITA